MRAEAAAATLLDFRFQCHSAQPAAGGAARRASAAQWQKEQRPQGKQGPHAPGEFMRSVLPESSIVDLHSPNQQRGSPQRGGSLSKLKYTSLSISF